MRVNIDDVITVRMIAADRDIPIPTAYWILNGKKAPDPIIQHGAIRFYSRKAIEKFFKTYRPKRARGPNKKKKAA